MRILVTGAAGFVGRALLQKLGRRHEVVALDHSCQGLRAAEAIEGDLSAPEVLERAMSGGCDAIVHLATVPGGAAEQNPALGWTVNMDATAALVDGLVRTGRGKRVVFASSIAVFGDKLPSVVDDATPLRPRLLYGAHKAMAEQWLATRARRGDIEAVSLRFPGIVARPKAPSGMKSAFMSDIFHAAIAGEHFVAPVSAGATMWLMSIDCIAENLRHAIESPLDMSEPYAVTLPAVRASMGGLIAEIAAQTGRMSDFARHEPDEQLEADFGRYPELAADRALELGFQADNSLEALVAAALGHLRS